MGVRVTTTESVSALFDSVSGFAFGPTFSTPERAEAFIEWYGAKHSARDLRQLSGNQLETLYAEWAKVADAKEPITTELLTHALGQIVSQVEQAKMLVADIGLHNTHTTNADLALKVNSKLEKISELVDAIANGLA